MNDLKKRGVVIIDFGSQYTKLIARRIRENLVFSEILPPDSKMDVIMNHSPAAIILSGGPRSVNDESSPSLNKALLQLDIPILGICYGLQLLVKEYGCKIESEGNGEYGFATIDIKDKNTLFLGLKDISKVCSIELQMVQDIFLNKKFELSNEDFIDEKNFKNINFNKDSLKKISEIVSARIAEIADIILNKNKHLKNSQTKDIPFYFYIEDESIYLKLKKYFEKYFLINNFYSNCLHEKDPFSSLTIFGELLAKGWTREAIPFINKKKSWFSRFFAHFFD